MNAFTESKKKKDGLKKNEQESNGLQAPTFPPRREESKEP